jgi:hypothetical protein
MGIKQQPLPQLTTGHMKWLFLWAHRELWQQAPKQSPLQECNISDVFYETSSPMSRRNETRLFHVRLGTTRIRNGHQTTTVTTTSHRSRENDCFSGPTGNFGNRHENRAYYCEINVGDVCGEPASMMSRRTGHVVGPPVSIGNGLLRCSLLCWHVCNGCSNWSPLLSDQCL